MKILQNRQGSSYLQTHEKMKANQEFAAFQFLWDMIQKGMINQNCDS